MKTYLVTMIAMAGLLTACNQSVESASKDFNTLPPAVQKTARAQAPNAEIVKADKTSQNGMDAYEVEYRNPNGPNTKVLIGLDGRVLNSDMPAPAGKIERALTPTGAVGTKFSALPEVVQKTIQTKAPATDIANISRHESNGRVIYEVEFTDKGNNPTIQVAEDGTLVQDLQK